MRRARADDQLVVRLGDPVEARKPADVDEQSWLRHPELQERNQAIANGEALGLPFAVRQDPKGLPEVIRPDVVELSGDHRAAALLPCQGMCRPVSATDAE